MESAELVSTSGEHAYISLTLDAGTWKALSNIFKQVGDEITLFRDGDRPALYQMDKGHTFMLVGKLSAEVEGEAEGVVFTDELYNFVRKLDDSTPVIYKFKLLRDDECEVSIHAKGQGVETFRREYPTVSKPFSIEYDCSVECSTNVKTLKQLFSLFTDIATIKIVIDGGRLTVWSKQDGEETKVSLPVKATGSDSYFYTGYLVAKIVKHLPTTAMAKINLFKPKSRSSDRILGITAYYNKHELMFLIAPRIVEEDQRW